MDNEVKHYGALGMNWGHTNDEQLQHYGKLGMKWGKRSARLGSVAPVKAIGLAGAKVGAKVAANYKEQHSTEFKKEYKQMQKDTIRHPIASVKSQGKLLVKNPGKALNLDTKSAKAVNADTAARVAASKAKKAERVTKKLNPQKVIDGKNLSQALLDRAANIAISQFAGLALVKTGHLSAGVILSTAGTYYNVGRGIGEVLDRRE